MQFELPFPPSINHLWRHVGPRTLMSRGGRAFRRAVHAVLAAQGVRPIAGRLAITIEMYPPDRRRRDLDNALKALLDALQHGGAYHDDSQIDELHIRRCACVPGGRVSVWLVPLVEGLEAEDDMSSDAPGRTKPRTCLKCDKFFRSSGPGNRLCPRCRYDNDQLKVTESEVNRERGAKRRKGDIFWPLDGGIV